MATDFRMQNHVDPTAVAGLYQRKAQFEQEQELAEKKHKLDEVKFAVDAGTSIASTAIAASKAKQKQDFINSFAEMIANERPQDAPVGPLTLQQASTQQTLKAATQVNPDAVVNAYLDQKMPKASVTGVKGTFQQGTATVDGKPMLIKFDTSRGVYLDLNDNVLQGSRVRGFKPDTRTSATTGQTIQVGSDGTAVTVDDPSTPQNEAAGIQDRKIPTLTLAQGTVLDRIVKEYDNDPVQVAARTTLSQLDNLEAILTTDSAAATEPLKSLAARVIAAEKGVLTDKDVARQTGSQALLDRLKRLVKTWYDGKMTDTDKANLKAVMDEIKRTSNSRMDRTTQKFAHRAQVRLGVPREEAAEYLRLNTDFAADEPIVSKAVEDMDDASLDAALAEAEEELRQLQGKQHGQ